MSDAKTLENILLNLEEFIHEVVTPLYRDRKTLPVHYVLMFSAGTLKHFIFQQEQLAPVMIHAVASKLAHSVKRLQGVAVLAAGVDG